MSPTKGARQNALAILQPGTNMDSDLVEWSHRLLKGLSFLNVLEKLVLHKVEISHQVSHDIMSGLNAATHPNFLKRHELAPIQQTRKGKVKTGVLLLLVVLSKNPLEKHLIVIRLHKPGHLRGK